MKEKELIRQISKIRKHIVRKNIIDKAIVVAEQYGVHKSEVFSAHTKVKDKFSGKDYLGRSMDIERTDGWSMFGGGDLIINYDNKRVFYADTSEVHCNFNPELSSQEKELPKIKIGELYVHDYSPGKWEQQLALIYLKGPKKEKPIVPKLVEREVEQSLLEDLAKRLPLKL